MVRKMLITAALGGTMVLGGAGGALALGASPAGAATTTHTVNCAKAPAALAALAKAESRINTALPKAEARQTKAEQAGHTDLAHLLSAKITWLNAASKYDTALQQKITTACPTSSASSSTTS